MTISKVLFIDEHKKIVRTRMFSHFSRAGTICTFTPLIYDKLKAAKYIDEVVEASVNYVNEDALKEVRPCLKTAEKLVRQSA